MILGWAGVNTGIMLARNDKGWSEEFWGDVARVSRINQEVPLGQATPQGRIKVHARTAVGQMTDHLSPM